MARQTTALFRLVVLFSLLLPALLGQTAAAQEEGSVTVVIQEMLYDSAKESYTVRLGYSHPEHVGLIILRVVDGNGTDVDKYPIEPHGSQTAEVVLNATGFAPGGQYTVVVWAVDPDGHLIPGFDPYSSGGSDDFTLAQREFTHSKPTPRPIVFSVQSVTPSFENGLLTVDLEVPLAPAVVSCDGYVVGESGQKLLAFGPQPYLGPRLEIGLPDAMRQGNETQEYLLTVNLTTSDGVRSKAEREFKVTPPRRPGLGKRIRDALHDNPAITASIVIVLCAAATAAILLSRRKSDPLRDPLRAPPVDADSVPGALARRAPEIESEDRSPEAVGIRVRVVRTPGTSQVPARVLRAYPISIGRKSGDIRFPADQSVSREHARITLQARTVKIEDLDSTNGTFVEGRRLQQGVPAALGPVTEVRLGPNTVIEIQVVP